MTSRGVEIEFDGVGIRSDGAGIEPILTRIESGDLGDDLAGPNSARPLQRTT